MILSITTTLRQCPRLRKSAVFLLLLLAMTATAGAQVTNIIYLDTFNRTGPLNGTTPSVVDNYYTNASGGYYTNSGANASWWAVDAPQANAVLNTDGKEICSTNFPNPTNGLFLNGFLPFTPQVGHVYTLSAGLLGLSGANQWLAFGYALNQITNNYYASTTCGEAWLLHRGSDLGCQLFTGPGTGSATTVSFANSGAFTSYNIVLDTTKGTAASGWVVTWYVNGVLQKTATYSPNPALHFVGVGNDAATGDFTNFSLTDYQPPSTPPQITEQPQSVTTVVGQKATFWVNALGVPAPSIQWMTNSPGGPTGSISGATSAIYTTTNVSMTPYNGLKYSVVLANFAGSVTSSVATLTVVPGAPTIYSAVKTTSGTNVVIMFSKPVSPATGLNIANYTLNNGATVLAAGYGSSSNSVVLMTSALNTNASYSVNVQNVQDLFGNTITNTTVPVLPASLSLYLRADSGVILDMNNGVSQWLDQTTNGNNTLQIINGPAYRPGTNSLNGLPAVNFNAANSNYLTAASNPTLALTTNLTIYAVANFADFNASREVVSKAAANVADPYDFYENGAAGTMRLYWGNGAANGFVTSTSALTPAVPYVVATTLSASNAANALITHYLNGIPDGSSNLTINQSISDSGLPVYIGGRNDLAQFMNGQMSEIMVFATSLSAPDRTNVDNYLGAKYFAFSITTNLPSSVTSSNGFTASFSIAANQGSAHLGYQWQENGTNIPGATGSAYTTSALAPSDNGDTFDVVLTLPGGTTNVSATTTLTVLNVAPYITSAGIPIWSVTNILVFFDEPVDPATATTAANYTLNNGATVLSAAIGNVPNKVVLTTSTLSWNGNPGYYTLGVQNVKDLYGNTIAPVSPSVGLYPPAVVLWVKADSDVTTDAGTNTVNQWGDLSGNGNNLMGASYLGFSEPLLMTNSEGDAVLHFSGTNSAAGTALLANDSPSLEITGDMSIIAVVNFSATNFSTAQGEMISKTGGSGSNGNVPAPYDYYASSSAEVLYRGNGTSSGQFDGTNAVSTGTPHIMAVSETGNIVTQYVDTLFAGSGPLSGGFSESSCADQGQPVLVGGRSDVANHRFLVGDIAELIVISSAISTNDLASLNTYLIAEHDLPIMVNPINPNPTNIVFSVSSGNQLTLSWPADHTGWLLQSNSVGLTTTNAWYTLSGSGSTNQFNITPNLTQTNVFFRLMYP